MHTKASQTFRQHCIKGHKQQCFAAMMVMRYLISRFDSGVERHRARVVAAINSMERKL